METMENKGLPELPPAIGSIGGERLWDEPAMLVFGRAAFVAGQHKAIDGPPHRFCSLVGFSHGIAYVECAQGYSYSVAEDGSYAICSTPLERAEQFVREGVWREVAPAPESRAATLSGMLRATVLLVSELNAAGRPATADSLQLVMRDVIGAEMAKKTAPAGEEVASYVPAHRVV